MKESSQFNTNDVLVHVNRENKKLFFSPEEMTFDLDVFPKVILREAEKTKKESGVTFRTAIIWGEEKFKLKEFVFIRASSKVNFVQH